MPKGVRPATFAPSISTSRNVFADGSVHRILLRKEDGEQIPSAATFVAFPDGLAGMIDVIGGYAAERLRGKLYDRLIPASLPLHDYADWRERFPLPEPKPSPLRLAVVIAGSSGTQQTLASLEAQSHENWTAGAIDGQPLPDRQRCHAGVSRGRRTRCGPRRRDHGGRVARTNPWHASPPRSTPILMR